MDDKRLSGSVGKCCMLCAGGVEIQVNRVPVPTESDWGNYHADVDQEHAHRTFAGRTNLEMIPHFRRNVIERTDELRWMPPIPFQCYMLGFREFVIGAKFEEPWAPDAASCFLGLVLEKLERQPEFIRPIMQELLPAARSIAANQQSFGATEAIYGSFRQKLARIEHLAEAISR